ncbi:MAG: restriction endonuclease subunit S [Bacteroidetes bacterium]|nr:restriction endonuclease subunit S [Bacteroidota bacterium]
MKAISYKHNWLEDIPSHWNKYPLWALFEDNKIKNEGNIISNVLSLSYGKIIKRDVESNMGLLPASFESYQIVNNGDILLRLTDLQNDKKSLRVGLVKEEGVITSAYTGLRLKSKDFNSIFYYFFLHSLDIMKYFYSLGGGVRQSIGFAELKWLKLPVPPKTEQDQIVAYIKAQSKKIKHFIKKKQTFIELLNVQRESVINKAVTKGSNPNVKLKDSGIVWLGKIPENWERTALKRLVSTKITDGPHETPNFVDDGIPFVSAEAAYGGRICLDRKRGFITPELHKEYSKKVLPQFGDIFIVKSGSTTGKTVIVDIKEEFNIWSPLALVRTNELINNEFMLFALQSEYFQHQVQQNWSFGTQPNIGMKVLEKLFIKFPKDIEEQKRIVSKIKTETAKIDQAIGKAQKEIELIKEYKEAMIAEAVLGKLNHKIVMS